MPCTTSNGFILGANSVVCTCGNFSVKPGPGILGIVYTSIFLPLSVALTLGLTIVFSKKPLSGPKSALMIVSIQSGSPPKLMSMEVWSIFWRTSCSLLPAGTAVAVILMGPLAEGEKEKLGRGHGIWTVMSKLAAASMVKS